MTTGPRNPDDWSMPLPELCLGSGWHAGLGIAPDGTTWPWLLAPDNPPGQPDPIRFPAHELTGPLPPQYAERLHRRHCGAPTKAGTPCRITAGYCPHHRKAKP